MKKQWLLIMAVSIIIFSMHYGVNAWRYIHVMNTWAQANGVSYLPIYIRGQEYFLGLSYALAGGFTVFSWFRFSQNRRQGAAGMIGGTALMAIIYWGGCFLIGCCGSPMLTIYLSLFGSSFLGFAKPVILGITILSIILNGVMFSRKKKCKCIDGECK